MAGLFICRALPIDSIAAIKKITAGGIIIKAYYSGHQIVSHHSKS
jgi:hypothetical protein